KQVGVFSGAPLTPVKCPGHEAIAAKAFDKASPAKRLHCIHRELNAGPDWGELRRLLVDLDAEAKSQQACCCREPANASADDRDASFLCRHCFQPARFSCCKQSCESLQQVRNWRRDRDRNLPDDTSPP